MLEGRGGEQSVEEHEGVQGTEQKHALSAKNMAALMGSLCTPEEECPRAGYSVRTDRQLGSYYRKKKAEQRCS